MRAKALVSAFAGTIMADQAVTLDTGATLDGRALARIGAVNLDSRADALRMERYLTEWWPGPDNYEPWAGSVPPNGTWKDGIRYVQGWNG